MNIAIIGIGSNIDPEINISGTLKVLKEKFDILAYSTFLKTKPIGFSCDSDFINGAVKIKTTLSQTELNRELKSIENLFGRDRSAPKFSSRTIDLDIVVWNGEIIDDDYFCREFLKKIIDEINTI